MLSVNKTASSTRNSLFEQKTTVEGYALLYRVLNGKTQDESGEEISCFDLEIALVGVPADACGEGCESVLLEDVARESGKATALATLLAEESVMPCTALEVMEELLSYGELSGFQPM